MQVDDELPDVLCCECGTGTRPNPTNMCVECLRSRIDITEGIARQVAQSHCRGCERYERSGGWVVCEPESKELLAILLKRVRGLDKVHLVDASFIWTEAHSKRMRVKLTVQREIVTGAVLQATLIVEFVISNKQCDKCARVEAKDYWVSCVQLRQKVAHKRTMFWLEQLILKHRAHADSTSIAEMRDGIDFFHGERNHSEKLLSFLQTVAPLRYKTSRQMITQDTHTGVCRNKYTYSIEVAPVCKDDLVCLPAETARTLASVHPLVLCTKVGAHLHFTDPRTLQTVELLPAAFWKRPFTSACTREHLREFVVLDVTPLDCPGRSHANGAGGGASGGAGDNASSRAGRRVRGKRNGKRAADDDNASLGGASDAGGGGGARGMQNERKALGSCAPSAARSTGTRRAAPGEQRLQLAEVTVARATDLGKNDLTYVVTSHLGGVLKAGDHVKGYDLMSRTLDMSDFPALSGKEEQLPEIVLVRKAYAMAKRKRRLWRLKALRKELDEGLTAMDVERNRTDYETFLRDLEEDKEMRAEVNLYKNPAALARASPGAKAKAQAGAAAAAVVGGDDDDDDGISEADVGLEELLDDLALGDNETFDVDERGGASADSFAPAPFVAPGAGAFHFT
ncbi:hypothetical protein KFE25_000799 [Diacronema lutheri]|uniref:60S ribosomal export protein NMD3 n=1 Tax=Diacronema lutheri TaxID=2081491 RepID=A0A8J6CH86_DIALT|nr:hypothetical protein KFE25_000799 [Diacronema lutheri]